MSPEHAKGMLVVIPARGGSKGIPRKNLQELGGRPLISWTIQAALTSQSVDRVIVSTEDERIADVARAWGADTPFLRPDELARDSTQSVPVVTHALNWLLTQQAQQFEYVMLIQPTSPFVNSEDIEAAHGIAVARHAETVISVFASHAHPYFAKRIGDDGRLENFGPWKPESGRRQDLPYAYALNGAIYLARTDVLLDRQSFNTDQTYGYVMPPERSLDIDTPWDLHLARLVANDLLQTGD